MNNEKQIDNGTGSIPIGEIYEGMIGDIYDASATDIGQHPINEAEYNWETFNSQNIFSIFRTDMATNAWGFQGLIQSGFKSLDAYDVISHLIPMKV